MTTFSVLDHIGSGGLADVSRVVDTMGSTWAMKQFRPSGSDDDQKQVSRFRQEIRIQSDLQHPHIVPVVASNLKTDPPFYIMELATESLHDLIRREGGLSPEKLLPIAIAIMSGLDHAHRQNVLHRDLKPQNILLFEQQVAKISDFGLGKQLDYDASYRTTTSDLWGTYWFAPPEQERGLQFCDARSDVFSLGRLLLNALTGTRPNSVPQAVDSRWAMIIRKAISDDPNDRWNSVAEMKRHLDMVFQIREPLVVDPDGLLQQLSALAHQESPISDEQVQDFCAKTVLIESDEILLRRVFDRIPPNLVSAWDQADPDGLKRFYDAFAATLNDGISFDYCDVVADQLAMIHTVTQNQDLRKAIRHRLFHLGPSHNRWHVGDVFGQVLSTVRDASEIADILTLMKSDPQAYDWNQRYLQAASIDHRIRCVTFEPQDS